MRNIETLRNYFLGKDPQLKETMADNSLRLIGIPGREFVLKAEMYKRLKELADTDADLQRQIDAVVQAIEYEEAARRNADNTLQGNIDAEALARQNAINGEKTLRENADNALSGRITTLENWKDNTDFVLVSDLNAALSNYYTKAEINTLIAGTLTYEVVEELPTTDISPRTIYMVPNGTEETPDYYDEYLYTGDVTAPYDPDKWELIGTTNIDLSGYVQKTGDTMTGPLTTTALTVGLRAQNSTVGTRSFVQGTNNIASGARSTALGKGTQATANDAYAEGDTTVASGVAAHAEGKSTEATALASHAEGLYCTATAAYAHAEGDQSFAIGQSSHAEGDSAYADGIASHAEGYGSQAHGAYSHAENVYASAMGNASHAEGTYTRASRMSQHVQGKYNIAEEGSDYTSYGEFADIVGNGTADNARSNAYTLDWNGNGWYAGKVYVGSASGTHKDWGSKELIDIDQIPTATATGETINVQDSSNLPIKDFAMLGNATQVTTTGKQLLDINNLNYGFSNVASSYNNLSTIEKGIRYNSTFNNGTPIVMFKIIDLNNYIGKTVRMKSNFTTKGEIRLGTANSDLTSRTQKASTYTSGTEISFTVTNDMGNNHYLTYALAIRSIASTGDTVDFTNLVITIDNADMTYEPYTGGNPAPNPDYPQDIHVVTGDNTVKVLGKNLIPSASGSETQNTISLGITDNIINVSFSGGNKNAAFGIDGSVRKTNYGDYVSWNGLKLKAGTYTLSYKYLSGTTNSTTDGSNSMRAIVYGRATGDTGRVRTNLAQVYCLTQDSYSSFTITEEMEINIVVYAYLYRQGGNSININFQVQLEAGSTATPYEPYIAPTTQLLSLGSIELARIPNTDITDVMFKAVSSNNPLKPSYYDTLPSEVKASLTVGKWYKQGNIGKYVVNEQTSLQKRNTSANNTYTYSFNIAFEYKIEASQTGNTLCNYFTHLKTVPGVTTMYNELLDVIGISLYYNSNSPNSRGIYINTNVELTTAWLTAHNIPIYYVLATPTTTEITDETLLAQLENVLKMHTNKNVTNASIEPTGTNAQAGLTLTYRQDLETILGAVGVPIATTINSSSTNSEVAGAKAVFDLVGDVESLLEELDIGGGVS